MAMDGSDQNQPHSTCAACGAANAPAILFCTRCTAPLGVAALADLDHQDLSLCRAALFEILANSAREEVASSPIGSASDPLWRAYLSAFWLRPETALILYAEALAVRSISDRTSGPWLDLGCGDGIHAALMAGWQFNSEFDAFQSLDLAARDIYHHWNPSQFRLSAEHKGNAVDFGLDIKSTAVSRARALGVFKDVQCADARKLPLEDESIGTIFSNMLRDLGEPLPAALRECRRVLTGDGVLLLSAMTPAYAGNLYFVNAARTAGVAGNSNLAARLLRLDRGRSVFCQRQLTADQWHQLFDQAGLKLLDTVPMVSPQVIKFWDVGLRPFSLPLLRQRQAWADAGVLAAIKPAAVDLISAQLTPLLQLLNAGPVNCMNLLVAGKA
jgi:SAM-dependent methyltransferase